MLRGKFNLSHVAATYLVNQKQLRCCCCCCCCLYCCCDYCSCRRRRRRCRRRVRVIETESRTESLISCAFHELQKRRQRWRRIDFTPLFLPPPDLCKSQVSKALTL